MFQDKIVLRKYLSLSRVPENIMSSSLFMVPKDYNRFLTILTLKSEMALLCRILTSLQISVNTVGDVSPAKQRSETTTALDYHSTEVFFFF